MKAALLALLASKKFLTTLVAIGVTIGARYGLQLDPEFCYAILGLFAVLLGAQGAADHGKSAAEINAANPGSGTQVAGGDIVNQPAPVTASGEVSA